MLLKKNKAEFLNCNLAGFGHTEGYALLDRMHAGDHLLMVREEENKHDHDAIALFYVPEQQLPVDVETYLLQIGAQGEIHVVDELTVAEAVVQGKSKSHRKTTVAVHVGYIPASSNTQLAMFMDYGHQGIFECVITSINKEVHPNQQVQIRVNLLRQKGE